MGKKFLANSQTNGQICLTQKAMMTINSQRIATIDVASTDGTFSSHRRCFMENKEKSRYLHVKTSDFSTTETMGFGGERQRDIPQSASEAGKSQPLGQQGVSSTVLIVQHRLLNNARKNLFIRNSFSNHINWNGLPKTKAMGCVSAIPPQKKIEQANAYSIKKTAIWLFFLQSSLRRLTLARPRLPRIRVPRARRLAGASSPVCGRVLSV